MPVWTSGGAVKICNGAVVAGDSTCACENYILGSICGCNADPDAGPFYALESQVVEATIAAGQACVVGKVGQTCVSFCVPGTPVPLPEGATVVDLSAWYADCQPCCDEGQQPPDPPCCEGDCTGSGGTGQQTCHNSVTVDEFENVITDVDVVWSATVVLTRKWCCPNAQGTLNSIVTEQQTITLRRTTPINQIVSGPCDPISGESEVFGPYTFNACPALQPAQVTLQAEFIFTTGDIPSGTCRPRAIMIVRASPIGPDAQVEAESCTTVSGSAGVSTPPETCALNAGTGESVDYVIWDMGVVMSAVAQGRYNCIGSGGGSAAATAPSNGKGIAGVLAPIRRALSALGLVRKARRTADPRSNVTVSRSVSVGGPCAGCGKDGGL